MHHRTKYVVSADIFQETGFGGPRTSAWWAATKVGN